MENYKQWSTEDFRAYLMIYAAYADFIITPEEEQLIINKVGAEKYFLFLKYFEGQKDIERIKIISELGEKYLISDNAKQAFLQEMKQVFFADDDYSLLEQNLFREIQKVI